MAQVRVPAQELDSSPVPDQVVAGRSRRVQAGAVLLVLAGTAAAVAVRNPHEPGSYGVCPSLLIFGVYCPGCGALRAMADVVAGDPAAAMNHNLLFLPALAGLLVWAVVQLTPRVPNLGVTPKLFSRYRWLNFPVILLIVVIAFGVLRNLPGSPLAP
ncbi:MAG: DUF2752 domain-containing protein [Actinomycetia bacterium]|nr:DUF2752 domain-containing protein [Actinomycetes bacterium]